jgi:gluconate 2-dehydrogenase gamma chain
MSEISRRDVLRNVGLSAMLGLTLDAQQAEHVHHMAAEDATAAGGAYQPKLFNEHEWATLRRLCDLIIPADNHSKGALDGGAPEFIDLLASHNDEIAALYTGGLAWIDDRMRMHHGVAFADASPEQQTALLDTLAYRKNATPDTAAGVKFFDWARKMTADAYYTSKVGIADLGYMGNKGMAKFEVPQAAIDYALKRSGLG